MNMIYSKLALYSLCRKPDDATNKYYAKKRDQNCCPITKWN
jgi:hypothetical protein